MSPELWFSIGAIIGLLTIVISIPVMLVVFEYDEPVFGVCMCVIVGVFTVGLWPLTIAAAIGFVLALWLYKVKTGRDMI